MPKRKNPRKADLTNEEIAKMVFPKKVRDELKKVAEKGKKPKKKGGKQHA